LVSWVTSRQRLRIKTLFPFYPFFLASFESEQFALLFYRVRGWWSPQSVLQGKDYHNPRIFQEEKEWEIVFIPQKITECLKEYKARKGIGGDQRIFPISYPAGREVMNEAGKVVGIHLRPLKPHSLMTPDCHHTASMVEGGFDAML
jgi:hypothetical protein